MQSDKSFYSLLGVMPSASIQEITRAYRKLAFQHHPDRNQMNFAATGIMQEINEAYATISDPAKRQEYDTIKGYRAVVPKFRKGTKVRVSSDSNTPYRNRTGVVDQEPIKDSFRFWYMVKFKSQSLVTVSRFPEEELHEVVK